MNIYMGTAKSIGEYSKIESKNVWVIYNPDDTPHRVNYKPDETPGAWHPKSMDNSPSQPGQHPDANVTGLIGSYNKNVTGHLQKKLRDAPGENVPPSTHALLRL